MTALRKHLKHISSLRGMSLVELLVAMVLSVFVIGTVITIFVGSKQSYQLHESLSRIQENGRYALQVLGRDIRLAGHLGEIQEYWRITESPSMATQIPVIANECFTAPYRWVAPYLTAVDHDGNASTLSVFGPKIMGSNDDRNDFASCISDANHVDGTDIISIHYVGPQSVPNGSRVQNQLYLRADINHGVIYRCSDATGSCVPSTGSPWDATTDFHYPVQAMAYFIRPCAEPGVDNTCNTADDVDVPNIPSLVRLRLLSNGTLTTEVVAEGIENMQIQYGVDNTYQGFANQYRNANSIGNATSTASWPGWNRVLSARIWILARSIDTQPGYTDTKTYTMAGVGSTPGGNYRRQLFSMTSAIRNYSE